MPGISAPATRSVPLRGVGPDRGDRPVGADLDTDVAPPAVRSQGVGGEEVHGHSMRTASAMLPGSRGRTAIGTPSPLAAHSTRSVCPVARLTAG